MPAAAIKEKQPNKPLVKKIPSESAFICQNSRSGFTSITEIPNIENYLGTFCMIKVSPHPNVIHLIKGNVLLCESV